GHRGPEAYPKRLRAQDKHSMDRTCKLHTHRPKRESDPDPECASLDIMGVLRLEGYSVQAGWSAVEQPERPTTRVLKMSPI
ncbi:Uncharacterized protein DAT39_010517, partial [Clarias magur]